MNYGLPYMGSKRKLATKIVGFIMKENPKAKYFYDLFGGGGAISFNALNYKRLEKVVYNDLDIGIVELIKDIINNGVTDKYYKWITREEFNKHKTDLDWYGGFIKSCWSFGNDMRSYIFGKDIEEDKRLLHEIVVNECKESIKIFNQKHGVNIKLQSKGLFNTTIKSKRIFILNQIKQRIDLQQLEQLQQLQQLERLQQLEQLEQLERLQILNKSYINVDINTPINETVIYLDPPYINTKQYQEKINYNELYEWIEKSKYKIYLSSYESSLKEVLRIKHKSTLSANNNNKIVEEKLYAN